MCRCAQVQPQGHVSCPPNASDPTAKSIAHGDRDRIKQDALYVQLSEDGDVISVPTQVSCEMIETEIRRTKRLGDLVAPLREGALGPVLDYRLVADAMKFLLLDKRGRPFLILKESEFDGPVTSATGITWPHSIKVLIENISDQPATVVSGHATILLDEEAVRPSFVFNQFEVDPYITSICAFFVSEEIHTCGTSGSHKLRLYVNLDYQGIGLERKYHARMWSTYNPTVGTSSRR